MDACAPQGAPNQLVVHDQLSLRACCVTPYPRIPQNLIFTYVELGALNWVALLNTCMFLIKLCGSAGLNKHFA